MIRIITRRTSVLLAAAAMAACVSRTIESTPSQSPPDSSVAPALALEQFLRAANASDLDTMSRLFGTKDGPWAANVNDVDADRRMLMFASVLKHEDYLILGDALVPGRRNEATQLNVRLTREGKNTDVPFVMVWAGGLGWMVEQFDIQRLIGR